MILATSYSRNEKDPFTRSLSSFLLTFAFEILQAAQQMLNEQTHIWKKHVSNNKKGMKNMFSKYQEETKRLEAEKQKSLEVWLQGVTVPPTYIVKAEPKTPVHPHSLLYVHTIPHG